MKKVYSAHSPIMVALLKEMLEVNGIRCLTRNELLAGGVGELPPIECWPELWIFDDDQYELARRLIKITLDAADRHGPTWQCVQCGESLDGQFTQCWSCGRLRESGG